MAREYTVKINVQSEKAAQQIEQFSAKALANIEKINKVEIKPKTTTKDVEVSLNRLQEASVRAATAETNRAAAADRAAATTARAHATEVNALEKTKQKELDLEKATVQANARMEVQRMRMEQGQNAMHGFANATKNAVNQLKMLVGYAGATQMLRSALTEMKAMSDELVTYQKVTGATAAQMKQVRADAYSAAKAYGQTPSDFLASSALMARAGYGQKAGEMAKLATKTQLVGDMSAEAASKFLIAVDAGYRMGGSIEKLTEVINDANVADNKYATSLAQIAEGMTLVAPLAASMNTSVEETIAAIGTMQALTQRSGTEVARAFRMIAINIAKDTETEVEEGFKLTEENIDSFNALMQEFAKNELAAADAAGKLLNPMKAIEALAKAWKSGKLSEQNLFTVLNKIGGARYTNSIMALVKNFDVYQEMLGKFSTELTSADDEVNAMLGGWTAKLNILKTTWTELVNNRVSEDFIKSLLDMGTGFLKWTGNLENFISVAGGAVLSIKALGAGLRSLSAGTGFGAGNALGLAVAGFLALTGAIRSFNEQAAQKRQNSYQQSIEHASKTAKEAYDHAKEINDIIAEYNKLTADGVIDSSELEQARSLQDRLNALVADTGDSYDIVNTKIETMKGLLNDVLIKQQNISEEAAEQARHEAASALVKKANDTQGGIFGETGGLNVALGLENDDISTILAIAKYVKENGNGILNFNENRPGAFGAWEFIGGLIGGKYSTSQAGELFETMFKGDYSASLSPSGAIRTASDVVNYIEALKGIMTILRESAGSNGVLPDAYDKIKDIVDVFEPFIATLQEAEETAEAVKKKDYSKEVNGPANGGSTSDSGTSNAVNHGIYENEAYAKSYDNLQRAITAAYNAQETFNASIKETKADGLKFYGTALEALKEEAEAGRANSTKYHAAARALLGDEAYDKTGGFTQNVQAAMNATGSAGISLIDAITTLTAEYKNQAGEVREGAGLAVLLEKLGYNVKDSQGHYVVKMTEDMYKEVMAAIPGLTREMLENAANAYDQYDVKGRNTNLAPEEKELTEEQQNAQTNKETAEMNAQSAEVTATAAERFNDAANVIDDAANKMADIDSEDGGEKEQSFVETVTKDAIESAQANGNDAVKAVEDLLAAGTKGSDDVSLKSIIDYALNIANNDSLGKALTVKDILDSRAKALILEPKKSAKYTTAPEATATGIDLRNYASIYHKSIKEQMDDADKLAADWAAYVEAKKNGTVKEWEAQELENQKNKGENTGRNETVTSEWIGIPSNVVILPAESKNSETEKGQSFVEIQKEDEKRKAEWEKRRADDAEHDAYRAKKRAEREKTESEKQDEKTAAEENNKRIGELTDTVNEIGQNIQGQAESTEKAATVITDSGMLEYYKKMRSIAQNGGKAANDFEQSLYNDFVKSNGLKSTKDADNWLGTQMQNLEAQVNVGMGETPEIEYNDIEIVADIKAKLDEYTVDEAVAALDLIDERVKPAYIEAVLDKYSLGEVLSALKYTTDENRVAVIKAAVDKFGIDQVKAEFAKLTDEDQTVYIKALVAQGEYQLAASLLSGLAKSKSAAIIAQLDQSSANRVNAELNALAGTRTSVIQVVEQKVSSTVSQAKDAFSNASSPWEAVGGVVSTLTGKKKAVGTTRHPGGPAIVNDGTGAELYIDSSGAHVANGGREAIINLEKGAKVYTAEQTRRMLGKVPQFENSSTPDQGRVQELADWVNSYFDTISTNDTQYTASGSNKGSDKGSGKSGKNKSSATVTNSGGSGSAAEAEDKRWDELKSLIEYILKRLNKALEKQESIIDKQIEELQARKSQSEQENKLEELQKAVSEAQANLQEAMNQRSVRYLDDNGQWHWMADQKKVEQAKKELDESQKSLQDYLNDLFVDAQIQALENEKKRLSEEYSEYTDLWSDILDAVDTPTGELVALISSLTATGTGAQKNGAAAVRNLLISALQGGSYKANYTEALGEIAKATANNPSVPGVSDEYLAGLIASSGTRISHSAMYDALQSIAGGGTLAAGSAAMETTNHQDTYYMINGVQIGSDMAELPRSEVLRRLSIMTNI